MPRERLSRSSQGAPSADRVLVTGASGLLGQHLVRQLRARGFVVRAFLRAIHRQTSLPGDVEYVCGDIRNPTDVRAAVTGCRYVFHACCTHVYNLSPQEVWAVNVDGTRNVCTAVRTTGCERFIFTSTISTFKRLPGAFTPRSAMPARQRNTVTKQVAEDLVLACVQDGLPAVIVNPAFFIGPFDYQPSPFRLWFPLAIICRIRIAPRGGFNVVGASDVAAAHLWALDHGAIGARYPIAGENITLAKFISLINKALGRPGNPRTLPDGILRFLARGRVFDSYVAGMLSRLNYIEAVSPVAQQPLEQVIEETTRWFSDSSPLVDARALLRYVWQRYF